MSDNPVVTQWGLLCTIDNRVWYKESKEEALEHIKTSGEHCGGQHLLVEVTIP